MSESAIDRVRTDLGLSVDAGARFRRTRVLLARVLRPFLIHQAQLNTELIAELRRLAVLNDGLAARLEAVEAFDAATAENHLHHHEVLTRHDLALEYLDAVVTRLDPDVEEFITRSERTIARLGALIELVQQQAMTRTNELVGSLTDLVRSLEGEVDELRRGLETEIAARREHDETSIGAAVQREFTDVRAALDGIAARVARFDRVLEDARRELPIAVSPRHLEELPSTIETIYPALQEVFRGDEQTVTSRVVGYLDDLARASKFGPVLDIGSGRGELLELLRERGIQSYGIESNPAVVAECERRGLRVYEEDAFDHLRSISSGTLGAVVAIHVVEHFSFEDVVRFLESARVALASGGIVILETPNPENVRVGTQSFYLDPTHLKPVPPLLLEWLVKVAGFEAVEVRRLARDGAAPIRLPEGAEDDPALANLVTQLNSLLFGPEDYAVIARRT